MSNRYDRANIETMELLYGRGYLSMGGDAEVARIVAPINVRGGRLLDIGCGLGGATITLARDQGAEQVVGIDIDAGLLERAGELVDAAALSDRIELIQVEPGPLPFSGGQLRYRLSHRGQLPYREPRAFPARNSSRGSTGWICRRG